ncbi:MAG: hypothetical protein ACKVLD_08070 [Flavobacteriales bacterium]|jgi:hypothetical protein
MKMNSDELKQRIDLLKGDPNSMKNQSIQFITSQQYRLIMDTDNWETVDHSEVDDERIVELKYGFKKRNELLQYIYKKLK